MDLAFRGNWIDDAAAIIHSHVVEQRDASGPNIHFKFDGMHAETVRQR